jgi:glycosyltransferase involved in cell wall biosynthesis
MSSRETMHERAESPPNQKTLNFPIIVHSHLQWDWVWQRPQQFMSRLAQRHPVLFVEMHAPSEDLEKPVVRTRETPVEGLLVMQMQFPLKRWGDGEWVDRERRVLLQEALAGPLKGRFEEPVQWFYDPMAVTAFAGHMGERGNVYDCMDELSKFRGAPPGLVEREQVLLRTADLVFAGGRRLWEAKRRLNPSCYFYGCGVDYEHFHSATLPETTPPPALASDRPRLGFFGVIDERIDYSLLSDLADHRADWEVVVVGPTAKINPAALPRRPNLYWHGPCDYAGLPSVTKAFNVCLMPFALNESTEFINPTKTLEYMATGRPIISTAVPDVVTNFESVVKIARNAREFIDHCECQLGNPDAAAIRKGLEMARLNSWERITDCLERHVDEMLASKENRVFYRGAYLNLAHRGGMVPLSVPQIA